MEVIVVNKNPYLKYTEECNDCFAFIQFEKEETSLKMDNCATFLMGHCKKIPERLKNPGEVVITKEVN